MPRTPKTSSKSPSSESRKASRRRTPSTSTPFAKHLTAHAKHSAAHAKHFVDERQVFRRAKRFDVERQTFRCHLPSTRRRALRASELGGVRIWCTPSFSSRKSISASNAKHFDVVSQALLNSAPNISMSLATHSAARAKKHSTTPAEHFIGVRQVLRRAKNSTAQAKHFTDVRQAIE